MRKVSIGAGLADSSLLAIPLNGYLKTAGWRRIQPADQNLVKGIHRRTAIFFCEPLRSLRLCVEWVRPGGYNNRYYPALAIHSLKRAGYPGRPLLLSNPRGI